MSEEARQLWERICRMVRRYQESTRFPRKWRVLINGIGILTAAAILYIVLGCPTLSVEAQYRRMEKAHMVGPARILGIEEVDFSHYDHILMADDGEGVILYVYDSQVWNREDHLVYREKTGDITVLAGPAVRGSLNHHGDFELPVVVFDSYPEASYARVEIRVSHRQESYVVECHRKNEGYFMGTIPYEGRESGQGEVNALQQLADLSNSASMSGDMAVIPIRVWLYDDAGALVCEETVELRSVANENREKREGGE